MKEYIEWLENRIEICLEDKDLQREHWAFCQALTKINELQQTDVTPCLFFRLVYTDKKGDQFYTISNKETEELALDDFYKRNPDCNVYRVDTINKT
jgi:hypothetical protein